MSHYTTGIIDQIWIAIMSNDQNEKNKLNVHRVAMSVVYYLLFCILLVLLYKKREQAFYHSVADDSWNFYRYLWSLAWAVAGFASIALRLRCHPKLPYPEYITHYPMQLAAMAAIVFGVLHIFENTSNFVYYYLSAAMCFTLGYAVDSYWSYVKGLLKRLS